VPFQNLIVCVTCIPAAASISIRVGLTETGKGAAEAKRQQKTSPAERQARH